MRIKLVIVDDAPFMREAIRNILLNTDIELIGEARDGEEAVLLAKDLRPDVILMDMVLPKMNGIEASRQILEKNPKIKIIACSTESQENLLMQALDVGCCSFLTKPFKKDELLNIIHATKRNELEKERKK